MNNIRCSCVVCKKEFSHKGLFTHFIRSHQNKHRDNNSKKTSETLKLRNFNDRVEKMRQYYANPRYCLVCDSEIIYDRRNNKTCSRRCGAIHGNQSEYRSSIEYKTHYRESRKSTKITKESIFWGPYTKIYLCKCKFTGELFYSSTVKLISSAAKTEKELYYEKCKFKFDIYSFPDEFDIQLLEAHGWYSAKNRGDNFYGCSRDHMISISYGFKHKIDPKIISHPANCRIIQNIDNQRKRHKCSVTLEELISRIKSFDEKYGHVGEF